MIIESKWFCKLLGVRGITLFPFVIVNDKDNYVLVNHEMIHYKQQRELWVIPFYFMYIVDYLKNRKLYKNQHPNKNFWSYLNIYFEREAFANQSNLFYLLIRKPKAYKNYK